MENLFNVSEEIKQFFLHNCNKTDPESIQNVILSLREMNVSQMQTVFLLKNECGFSFQEANEIVLMSKAWNRKLRD